MWAKAAEEAKTSYHKKLGEATAERDEWREVIAVLCGDGGHYHVRHGTVATKEHVLNRFYGLLDRLDVAKTENDRLRPFEQAIKQRHNGYDPEAREMFPEEPATPGQALDELLAEARWLALAERKLENEDLCKQLAEAEAENERLARICNELADKVTRLNADAAKAAREGKE